MPKTKKNDLAWVTPRVAKLVQDILDAIDGEHGFWIRTTPEQQAINEAQERGISLAENAVVEVMRKAGLPIQDRE